METWSKRIRVAIGGIALYAFDKILSTVFGFNFEDLLTNIGAAKLFTDGPPDSWGALMSVFITDWIAPSVKFLFGNFGLGLVTAAVLFVLSDRLNLQRRWAERKARPVTPKRDPAKDEKLAEQCDELARDCLEMEAEIRGIAMKHHWAPSKDGEKMQDQWLTARREEAIAMEKFSKREMHKFVKIINELKFRLIDVDTWGIGVENDYYLKETASFLDEAARLLRSGAYTAPSFQGKALRATRF